MVAIIWFIRQNLDLLRERFPGRFEYWIPKCPDGIMTGTLDGFPLIEGQQIQIFKDGRMAVVGRPVRREMSIAGGKPVVSEKW